MSEALRALLYLLLLLGAPLGTEQWDQLGVWTGSTIVPGARITEYIPALGGINCREPCDLTGYMEPLRYGVTAACGLDLPYNTRVLIRTLYGVVERRCLDHGGAITNERVDIAMDANGPTGWYYGYYLTVWLGWREPKEEVHKCTRTCMPTHQKLPTRRCGLWRARRRESSERYVSSSRDARVGSTGGTRRSSR